MIKLGKVAQIGMAAALAQIPTPPPLPVVTTTSVTSLFATITRWVLFIAGFIAVLFLIYGGFQYLTAGGNAEQVTKAKTTIINAIIGIVVIAVAYAIYTAVANILGSV